jgi:hypothetical protein
MAACSSSIIGPLSLKRYPSKGSGQALEHPFIAVLSNHWTNS